MGVRSLGYMCIYFFFSTLIYKQEEVCLKKAIPSGFGLAVLGLLVFFVSQINRITGSRLYLFLCFYS